MIHKSDSLTPAQRQAIALEKFRVNRSPWKDAPRDFNPIVPSPHDYEAGYSGYGGSNLVVGTMSGMGKMVTLPPTQNGRFADFAGMGFNWDDVLKSLETGGKAALAATGQQLLQTATGQQVVQQATQKAEQEGVLYIWNEYKKPIIIGAIVVTLLAIMGAGAMVVRARK